MSETTVRKGVFELKAGEEPLGRVRRPGGGRKRVADLDPGLRPALLAWVKPRRPAGDPAPVHIHDFADPHPGKAIPYGVYEPFRSRTPAKQMPHTAWRRNV